MGRARAMMNHAGFTMAKRQQLWCEAAQTATMLDNILVQESAKSPPFTQFFGVDAKYAKHLRVFGEMCVVADTDNKVGRTKIDPRGKISLFVGYSTQHAGDVYRLLNPKTSRVIHSRDVKWIGKTKTLGLRMVPIFNDGVWKLEALSDSDFANDKDTRYSVYGYIIYFCGVPEAWKSKSMKSFVLSTTEAEYVAVSEVVKEIKFLYQMLRSMEIKVPLPIKVQVDNVGAIWLANNSSVSERTKHVDLRAHFVRDMIKDQVIEINFVKSAENDSDIMTKNQQGQHYMYAKSKLVYTVQEMNEKKNIQDEETGRMLES